MHELGLIVDLVDMVDRIALQRNMGRVKSVLLDVGELYYIIPSMMQGVYRSAIKGTRLEGSELILNEIPALARCLDCGSSFNPLREDGICPNCGASNYTVKAGKEFEIRQIEAESLSNDQSPAAGSETSKAL